MEYSAATVQQLISQDDYKRETMANPMGVRKSFWSASRLAESHTFEMSKVGLVVYMVGVYDWHFDRWLWELLLYEVYIWSCYYSEKRWLFEPVSSTRAFLLYR